MALFWKCPNGHNPWNHEEQCGLCGAPRPEDLFPSYDPKPQHFVRSHSPQGTPQPAADRSPNPGYYGY